MWWVADHDVNETKLKYGPAPTATTHEFEAQWAAVGQGLPKLEKYSLVSGLSINFFFGFNDAKMVRNSVQANHAPGWLTAACQYYGGWRGVFQVFNHHPVLQSIPAEFPKGSLRLSRGHTGTVVSVACSEPPKKVQCLFQDLLGLYSHPQQCTRELSSKSWHSLPFGTTEWFPWTHCYPLHRAKQRHWKAGSKKNPVQSYRSKWKTCPRIGPGSLSRFPIGTYQSLQTVH